MKRHYLFLLAALLFIVAVVICNFFAEMRSPVFGSVFFALGLVNIAIFFVKRKKNKTEN